MSEQRSSEKAIVWQGKNHRAIVPTENAPQGIVKEQLSVPRDDLAIKKKKLLFAKQLYPWVSNSPLKKQLFDKEKNHWAIVPTENAPREIVNEQLSVPGNVQISWFQPACSDQTNLVTKAGGWGDKISPLRNMWCHFWTGC